MQVAFTIVFVYGDGSERRLPAKIEACAERASSRRRHRARPRQEILERRGKRAATDKPSVITRTIARRRNPAPKGITDRPRDRAEAGGRKERERKEGRKRERENLSGVHACGRRASPFTRPSFGPLCLCCVAPRNPISVPARLRSRRFRRGKRQRSRSNYVNPLPRSRYISIPSSCFPLILFRFDSLSLSHRSHVSKGGPRETFSHAHNIKTLLRPFRFPSGVFPASPPPPSPFSGSNPRD